MEIIQIIEDEPEHAKLLDMALRKARYRTNVAHDGQTGLSDTKRLHPVLILLDIMLPEMDGLEVCRRLRKDPITRDIPIIMISALGSEEHRLAGLELGVDDYITKPFSPKEVVARVRAVLRRGRPAGNTQEYMDGNLVLEDSRFIVSCHGRRMQLSEREWRVLQFLAERNGQMAMREEVIAFLWGEDGLVHERELERDIQELKQKLESGQDSRCAIHIIPNMGFRLAVAPVNNGT